MKIEQFSNINTKHFHSSTVSGEHVINGRKYIVKNVFVGTQDIQTAVLRLAEQKTLEEMGVDITVL